MSENRKNIRVDIQNECVIISNKEEFNANLLDITTVGVGLESKDFFETDEILSLKTYINDELIEIEGRIVFSYKKEGKYRYGFEFTKIQDESFKIIDRYIKKEITKYLSQSII